MEKKNGIIICGGVGMGRARKQGREEGLLSNRQGGNHILEM